MKKIVLEMHNAGFFSNFNKVINHLRYSVETAKASSFEVDWKASAEGNPRYHHGLTGDDLWSEFFEPLDLHGPFDTEIRTSSYADHHMTSMAAYYSLYTRDDDWRREYNRTLRKYIKLKAHIADEVESYYSRNLAGKHCIGVHVRNHAISVENPVPVPGINRFIEIAKEQLLPGRDKVVFLATDVESVLPLFRSAFGDALLCREGVARSKDHGSEINNHAPLTAKNLAKDVLVDCLLLARTDKFIHVLSNVATAVGNINPNLEMVYARYDKNDPRGVEPILEKADGLVVTQTGEDRFELCLGPGTDVHVVKGFGVLVVRLCDGTRTQAELIGLLRAWCKNKPVKNADYRAMKAILKLLRYGAIKRVYPKPVSGSR